IHGREAEGEAVVAGIEKRFLDAGVQLFPVPESAAIRLRSRTHTPLRQVFDTLVNRCRLRTFVAFTLMTAQAFLYNAIFFTYALVLTRFDGVSASDVGWYILPFAAGNFLGPVVLGPLFDTRGRRLMISLTYAVSGALLVIVGVLFERDLLSAVAQTVGWMIVFFVASPAANAAYLTVSETFPIEIRALAPAVFYALGTGLGGVAAPAVFGKLVESGARESVFAGYVFAALLMFIASVVAAATPCRRSESRSNRWRPPSPPFDARRPSVRSSGRPADWEAELTVDFLPMLTGCFAMPAAENPTVAMVEAAYRHHRIAARYINCEVPPELLGDAVRGACAMGWVGFNCSLPHKVKVIDHLDELGQSAALIGAVNTVVRRGDKFIGENTDGRGFVAALRTVVDPAGARVVMFGAGGAARAVGVELALAGASRIDVVNRGRERAEPLVALLNGRTNAKAEFVPWPQAFRVPKDVDIVINAT